MKNTNSKNEKEVGDMKIKKVTKKMYIEHLNNSTVSDENKKNVIRPYGIYLYFCKREEFNKGFEEFKSVKEQKNG